ncbi:Fatty acid synthase [Holothuria leucospilota]|uniref:Fatty acid synthase n=1 Tax=Holothuria leucospilota TaxID=206669 RepID=A0A9Q1H334_HOLLE|nr:Fatty acid synthase [Holothuria leucospilota]
MLKNLSTFDASFFGMLPEQVNKTDPQLRILLEVAYEAIVDAGKALLTLIIRTNEYNKQKQNIPSIPKINVVI